MTSGFETTEELFTTSCLAVEGLANAITQGLQVCVFLSCLPVRGGVGMEGGYVRVCVPGAVFFVSFSLAATLAHSHTANPTTARTISGHLSRCQPQVHTYTTTCAYTTQQHTHRTHVKRRHSVAATARVCPLQRPRTQTHTCSHVI